MQWKIGIAVTAVLLAACSEPLSDAVDRIESAVEEVASQRRELEAIYTADLSHVIAAEAGKRVCEKDRSLDMEAEARQAWETTFEPALRGRASEAEMDAVRDLLETRQAKGRDASAPCSSSTPSKRPSNAPWN